MVRELRIPPDVAAHPQAMEVLRVWIVGDDQKFIIRPDAWDDPAAWGLVLIDLAHHVARACAQKSGDEPNAVLARIKAGFDAEWMALTDPLSGGPGLM